MPSSDDPGLVAGSLAADELARDRRNRWTVRLQSGSL
jgi:hypothetical protein